MYDGIINVYKEKGFTSHDVVAKMRGILGQRKIGHTGTLDPAAEGVLPVCAGKGTKLCDMLTDHDKTYRAVLLLGTETDTEDTTGTVLETKETSGLTENEVQDAVLSFIGDYAQVPPMYSALKVDGKKLYELAREGKTVERKARPVKIFDIQIEKMELPEVTMTVSCSKGTYIRTLCHDIGAKLSVGGCMKELLRTKVGQFELSESLTLDELQKLKEEDRITGLHPGMREMLTAMKDAGLWSAIATGKSRAGLARVLAKTGSDGYFCASRTMDEAQSKPSPDMLRQLSDECCVPISKIVMIGDAVHDLEMANNAGAAAVGVTWGAGRREALEKLHPIAVVDTVPELARAIGVEDLLK